MAEAKAPLGDRHFYAIAISRWDNEGGATEKVPPHSAVLFTSATVDGLRSSSRIQLGGNEHEAGTSGASKDHP